MKKILLFVVLILFGITTQLTAQISALYGTPVASTAANPVWFFIQNATHFGVLELGATGTNTVSFAVPLASNNDRQLWRFEKDANGKYIIYNKGRAGRFDNAAQWVESGGTEVFTLPATTSPSFQIKPANNYLFNAATSTSTLNAVASYSGNNVAWRFINAPTSSTSASPVWYQWSSLRPTPATHHYLTNESVLNGTGAVNFANNDIYWRFESTTNGYKISNRTQNAKYLYRSLAAGTANNVTSSDVNATTFVLSPRGDASGSLLIYEQGTAYNATDYIGDPTTSMGLYAKASLSLSNNQHHKITGFLNVAPTINTPTGSYPSTQYVNITLPATESAFIAYTTDGSDPNTSVTRVISTSNTSVDVKLFNFLQSSVTVTVKACAYKPGFYSSTVVSTDYTLAASTTQWFYLQFANGNWVIADQGAGTILKTAAQVAGSPAQLWSIQEVTPGSKTYYLTSALGNKINFASSRYVSNATTGLALAIDNTKNTTYPGTLEIRQAATAATGNHMNMYGGAGTGKEIADYTYGDGGNTLRIVPLPAFSGNALNLNGSTNFMRIPHNAAFNFSNTEAFSISFWINSNLVAGRNARMIAKRGPNEAATTDKSGYELWGLNTTTNFLAVNTTTGTSNTNLYSVWGTVAGAATTWTHIAYVVTGTGTDRNIIMYQNGQVTGSAKISNKDVSTFSVTNGFDVFIGKGQYDGGSGKVNGKMDNIRFWNKGLTPSEVEADQTSNVNSSTPNLIAAYDFETVDLNAMTVADIKGTHPANLEGYSALTASVEQFGMSGRGNTNDPILRATVTVSATDAVGQPIAAVNLNSAILNLTGTTNLSDISSLKVYSTGSTVNFDPRDPITKGAVLLGSCSPAEGDITCTLSGTLAAGTNYLWITADIANNAVEGNQIDIALKSITAGSTHTLTVNNPTGTTNILLARKLIAAPGDANSTHYRIPAVITANDGSLLVFTDKRKYNNSDLPQDIDVVVHRSTDKGKTWSAATTIAQGTGVGAGFGDVATVKTKTGKIIALFAGGAGFGASTSSNPIKVYKSESTDNGISWSAPTDITSQLYAQGCSDPTRATWSGLFIASGQMLYTSTGRIMAVGLVRGDGSGTNNNYIVYSDDDGTTWTMSNSKVISSGDEAKIMELANGTFMVTSRKGGAAGRLKATSADGLTWTNTSSNISELVEPACNGDFIRYSKAGESTTGNILLHSIPNNASSRRNVSVFYSTNEGTSWTLGKSIVPEMANSGFSGYSSLTVLNDGTIGAYVEVENYSGVYEMYFMNFSLGWLTGGAQTFTPVYNLLGADDVTANYSSWANSSNQGCGFGAWTLASGGNAGFFLGDPSAAGITAGLPNPSFALYANTTGSDYANADRAFVAPLSIGSTLSVTWGVNWDANGSGNKGINLYTGGVSGAQIININMGSSAVITINGNTMFSNYGTSAITLNFEYKSAGQLRVYATGRDGSEVYDQTFAVTGAPDAIRFYASGLNTGVQRQPYFNNLKIVTDPSKIPAGSRVFVKGCAELAKNSEVIDLTIASGNTLAVNAGKQLTINGALTNNGTLNLLSSVDGTATIITGSVNGSGTNNVNQALTYRTWYMSSPVASASPTGMDRIKSYNEATNEWAAATLPMVVGKGYSITPFNDGTNNILFTGGTLNTGEKTIELQKDGSTSQAGFNFVGNPYPSYIDWKAMVTKNSAVLETNTMWYRSKIEGKFKFYTVDGAGVVVPSTSPSITAFVPPMQGFWVKTNTDASTLYFEDNMRSHAGTVANPSPNPLKAPAATQIELSLLRLQVSNGTNTDEAVIYSYASATDGYDFYDSPKMMNNDATIPEIYTTLNNKPMVINVMNSLPLDTEIGLAFVPGDATSFSLRASEITNLPSDVKVILKDYANNGQETDLTDGAAVYNFTPATTTGDRFSVIFRSAGSTTAVNTNSSKGISVYSMKNGINVTVNAELVENATLRVFNAVGQQLVNQHLTNRSTTINGNFNPGVYVVKVSNGTTVTATQKIVIK